MAKAVFLDRDGVILREEGHYNYLPDHFALVEGIVEALQIFQRKGYLLIVITNQAGIGKGIYNHNDVRHIHELLINSFKQHAICIKDIFYCPHHETSSKCICRKPDSLLLEKALNLYKINRDESYFIGDSDRDVLAGEKAGLKTIKINSNSNLSSILSLIS